jgi:hypothetical protein
VARKLGTDSKIIKSPIEGTFYILEDYSTKKILYTVMPNDSGFVVAGEIEQKDKAKIYTNQSLKIELDDYPENNYGYLLGTVEQISDLPIKNRYLLKIHLTNNTNTSKNISLKINDKTKGRAKAIFRDKSILQTLFKKIWKI